MMAYSQADVDKLNEEINDMRRRVEGLEKEVDTTKKKNKDLVSALNECNKAAEAAKENNIDMSMEPVVSFRQGKALVDAQQLSNIENIANYMKKNPEGLSVAVVRNAEQKEIIEHFSSELDKLLRPLVIVSEASEAFTKLEDGLMFSVIFRFRAFLLSRRGPKTSCSLAKPDSGTLWMAM